MGAPGPDPSSPSEGALDHLAWLSSRILLIVAAATVAAVAVVLASVVILPLFLGLLVTGGLAPLTDRLRTRGVRPALASLASVGLVIVVVGLLGVVCVSAVVDEWPRIADSISDGVTRLEEGAVDRMGVEEGTAARTGDDAREGVATIVSALVRGAVRILPMVTSLMTTAGLTLFVAFFFLKDGRDLWRGALDLAPRADRTAFAAAGAAAWRAMAGFVRGTAVIALADAAFIGLGAWALGVPEPLAITLLTAVAAFIPVLGATFAGAFAVLLALGANGFSSAVAMLVVVLVVQQIEGNLLQPLVLGKATALHPLVTMLAVVAGGAAAGVVGMLVAVPLTAGAVAATRELRAAGWLDRPVATEPR